MRISDFVNSITLDNSSVEHLCVTGNHYDPESDNSLAEMLSSNNTITALDMSSCQLRGLSKNIIMALCVNKTLTTLKLGRNGLRNNHVTAVFEVFSHPSQLSKIVKLDLSFNHISPESLSVLVSSLQSIKPRTLDELKLTPTLPCSGFQQVLPSLQSVVKNVMVIDYLHHGTLFADYVSQM